MDEEKPKTTTTETATTEPPVDEEFLKLYNRIVPFVIIIPVFFLILFVIVSMLQLRDINSRIQEGHSQTVKEIISKIPGKDTLSEGYKQFLALASLEEESLNERYRQGHYSLVSRAFKEYLGFFTGIIMVIVGSLFVLLKLREKIDTSASKGDSWKFVLVTSSPGVVFGIVGAVLISIASTNSDKISVRDSGLYLTREYLVAPFFSGSRTESGMNQYMRDHGKEDSNEDNVKETHPPKPDSPKTKTQTPPKNDKQ